MLVLALLGAVLALLGLAAPRHSRHALRNDHGVDLHTEAASHVVRRTDWHAIGQLMFSCASAATNVGATVGACIASAMVINQNQLRPRPSCHLAQRVQRAIPMLPADSVATMGCHGRHARGFCDVWGGWRKSAFFVGVSA